MVSYIKKTYRKSCITRFTDKKCSYEGERERALYGDYIAKDRYLFFVFFFSVILMKHKNMPVAPSCKRQ